MNKGLMRAELPRLLCQKRDRVWDEGDVCLVPNRGMLLQKILETRVGIEPTRDITPC